MRCGVAAWLCLVTGLVLATTAPVRAHPPSIVSSSAEKAVADEIRAFRKSLADAVVAKDKKRLGDLYAPSFQHTNEAGRVWDRDAHLATLLAGALGIETAVPENLVIRIPNDWVAIATGSSRIGPPVDGKPTSVQWTAVYTRTDKSWWLVVSHVSPSPSMKP